MRALIVFTLKSLRANRVRTLVTILGVALAAALLTAVVTSYTSLNGFLYSTEKETTGGWMAEVHSTGVQLLHEQTDAAASEPDVTNVASLVDLGFGQLTPQQQNTLGNYLPIVSYSGDIEELCSIAPAEGRLPETPDEIMLPTLWSAHEDMQIGDTLTIEVGRRYAVLAEGEEEDASDAADGTNSRAGIASPGSHETLISQDSELDSTVGYLDSGTFREVLTDLEEKTYTVVGFSDPYTYALSTGVGQMGIVGSSPHGGNAMTTYIAYRDMKNTDQIEERTEELFPSESLSYHSSLLRYLGIRGNGAIWDTFIGLASVLATVIIIACVSLIYNAFAISVAERARQFGLLASIGASRRQLRRAVLVEGLVIALIGIPLGILIGIGGCMVTFSFVGPMISTVLSNGLVEFKVTTVPAALIFSAALTLATVLVSVLIPALRTGRISPIEALKQNHDGKVSKRGVRDAQKFASPQKLWQQRGFLGRVFGTGGQLAHMNAKRSKAKGRAASLSLALAIVLLMTAGSFNNFVGNLVSAVDSSASYDIGVAMQLDSDSGVTEEDLAFYEDAYAALSSAQGADPRGWYLCDTMPLVLPENMVSSTYLTDENIGRQNAGRRADGTIGTLALVYYLDDNSFDEFARTCGVDPQRYYDTNEMRAIALDRSYAMYDGKYQQVQTLSDTGAARALLGGEYNGQPIAGFTWYVGAQDEDGTYFEFVPYTMDEDAALDLTEPEKERPLDLDALETKDIAIDCITSAAPDIISQHIEAVSLIVPASTILNDSPASLVPTFNAAFDAQGIGHAEVAENIQSKYNEFRHAVDQSDIAFYSINDRLAEAEGTRMLAMIINIFCLLFTGILTLIALANVFNTVTNGLILRRREFAVMRSIGLSNRQFRSMIAEECISYGMRGLVPGLILSIVVSFLLYRMIALSMDGMDFTLPWGYLGLAIALTVIAMVISVIYGMYRCKADNVVEALRAESV